MEKLDKDVTGVSLPVKGSSAGKMIYKIGDLAREFDVTLRTLRFYEDRGLITPARSGTTRLYSSQDRERLGVALFGKRIGLSLGEIQNILDLHERADEDTAAAMKLKQIYQTQLQELERRQLETNRTIGELADRIGELDEL